MLELNYKSFGQGPALIILHGLFGSLDNWVTLSRSLSEEYSVYLVDQRNHGKSPHEKEWNYDVMAEDLHDFMDQHGIMQAHLLGHSMGGKTVIRFAGEYPERIDKLIVADMGIKQYNPHHQVILETLASIDLHQLDSRNDAKGIMEKRIEEPGIIQFLLKGLGRDEDKNFQWKFNFDVIYHNYANVLAEVKNHFPFEGPTLFLSGSESEYVTEKDQPSILESFPSAQFEVIQGAGHWLHADSPTAFLEHVQNFLNG